MNYLTLLKARRKGGKIPTLEATQWSPAEQIRAAHGNCVICGKRPSTMHSFACSECQDRDTPEMIRDELNALRNSLLRSQG
jgi:hypothetical protein